MSEDLTRRVKALCAHMFRLRDGVRTSDEVAELMTAFVQAEQAAERQRALAEARAAVCRGCRENWPLDPPVYHGGTHFHQVPGGETERCEVSGIWDLAGEGK